MKEKLYPFIRMWGINMGSYEYYIENEILTAKNSDAPPRSIYRNSSTGEWITVDDLSNADLKHRLEKAVSERYPQWGGQHV